MECARQSGEEHDDERRDEDPQGDDRKRRREPPSHATIILRRLKVLVLTTSYPQGPDDPAGRFVADAVSAVAAPRGGREGGARRAALHPPRPRAAGAARR